MQNKYLSHDISWILFLYVWKLFLRYRSSSVMVKSFGSSCLFLFKCSHPLLQHLFLFHLSPWVYSRRCRRIQHWTYPVVIDAKKTKTSDHLEKEVASNRIRTVQDRAFANAHLSTNGGWGEWRGDGIGVGGSPSGIHHKCKQMKCLYRSPPCHTTTITRDSASTAVTQCGVVLETVVYPQSYLTFFLLFCSFFSFL